MLWSEMCQVLGPHRHMYPGHRMPIRASIPASWTLVLVGPPENPWCNTRASSRPGHADPVEMSDDDNDGS